MIILMLEGGVLLVSLIAFILVQCGRNKQPKAANVAWVHNNEKESCTPSQKKDASGLSANENRPPPETPKPQEPKKSSSRSTASSGSIEKAKIERKSASAERAKKAESTKPALKVAKSEEPPVKHDAAEDGEKKTEKEEEKRERTAAETQKTEGDSPHQKKSSKSKSKKSSKSKSKTKSKVAFVDTVDTENKWDPQVTLRWTQVANAVGYADMQWLDDETALDNTVANCRAVTTYEKHKDQEAASAAAKVKSDKGDKGAKMILNPREIKYEGNIDERNLLETKKEKLAREKAIEEEFGTLWKDGATKRMMDKIEKMKKEETEKKWEDSTRTLGIPENEKEPKESKDERHVTLKNENSILYETKEAPTEDEAMNNANNENDE